MVEGSRVIEKVKKVSEEKVVGQSNIYFTLPTRQERYTDHGQEKKKKGWGKYSSGNSKLLVLNGSFQNGSSHTFINPVLK